MQYANLRHTNTCKYMHTYEGHGAAVAEAHAMQPHLTLATLQEVRNLGKDAYT